MFTIKLDVTTDGELGEMIFEAHRTANKLNNNVSFQSPYTSRVVVVRPNDNPARLYDSIKNEVYIT